MANDNITGEVKRRTFAALKFPKDSPIRKELNKDSLTSEYMTSIKYNGYVYFPETETTTAYNRVKGARTKAEAEEWVIEQLKKHSS